MKYLFAPIFFMLFSSSYSQTYIYVRNESKPRFECYQDRIYEHYGGKRELMYEIEDTRMYVPSKMGYDGAGNPRIVPRALILSLSGSECYTYYREEGKRNRFFYKDDIFFLRTNDGELYSYFKLIGRSGLGRIKIYNWYPGHYNELVARVEFEGEPIYTVFMCFLAYMIPKE